MRRKIIGNESDLLFFEVQNLNCGAFQILKERNCVSFFSTANSDQGRGTKLSKEEKMSRARKMADLGVKQAVIADTLGVSVRMVKKYLNGK